MLGISFSFILGCTIGIEHISGDSDDEFHWAIPVHLGLVRLVIMNMK